jgi:hypothetical protein
VEKKRESLNVVITSMQTSKVNFMICAIG